MGGGAAAMKRSARARLDEEDRDNDRLSTHDQECQAGIEAKALGRATRKTYTKKLTRTSLTSQALSGMGNPGLHLGTSKDARLRPRIEHGILNVGSAATLPCDPFCPLERLRMGACHRLDKASLCRLLLS